VVVPEATLTALGSIEARDGQEVERLRRQVEVMLGYVLDKGLTPAPQAWMFEAVQDRGSVVDLGGDGWNPAGSDAERLLSTHVQTVCRRYGTRIYSYDVVNEAVQPETGEIRDTNVTRALGGEQFLDLMFHTARVEAPHAQLVYNDYMSWERSSEGETHIKGVLKLLEGFRKRGTPVDALGVQSHIRLLKPLSVAGTVRESEGPWRRFLDEVTGMGYQLLITEFDVNDRMAPTRIATRDRMVADYAQAYLDVMLSYPQLRDMLCWGMSDRFSWLEGFDPRADKARKRGTPYDASFRPKPLRGAIADVFSRAKVRALSSIQGVE